MAEDQTIYNAPYYHGLLPREDIRVMLKRNGDFLVRTTEPKPGQPRCFVLSAMFDEKLEEAGVKHYVIQTRNGQYVIERFAFARITEMVNWHLTKQEPISKDSIVSLKTPINRQLWELSHDDIQITKKLGEGAFGEVSLGTLRRSSGETVNVAIKQAKLENMTKEQIKEITREARLMRRFDHPNVVKLYGVAAGREPLMLVLELADKGSLDSYLQKNETSATQKVEMCMGAAWGVEYLHSKNVIHRDIAARNCLYSEEKVKISDFGLTQEGTVYAMDPKSRVPIRWLSPETLRTAMYSQKSDAYAFGILCWEIFSNGIEPYPGMTVAEVNVKVKDGYRMSMPTGCPPDVWTLIHDHCWVDSPNDRWSMTQVTKRLEQITNLPRPKGDQSAVTEALESTMPPPHFDGTSSKLARKSSKNAEGRSFKKGKPKKRQQSSTGPPKSNAPR
ncbi:protein tyrosine kinase domain-containing protein [Ditylenchus destructor]|nr:protein tyrosine kinase domain-containing protein [Ditylenchus destructor]